MAELIVPATFDPGGVGELLAKVLRVIDEPELVVSFAVAPPERSIEEQAGRPGLLALVAALGAARKLRGLQTRLGGDFRNSPLGALLAIGFAGGMTLKAAEEGYFQTLQRMVDLRAARDLADAAASLLEAQAPSLSSSVVRMARFVFEELAANVVQHSGRPETGIGLVQASVQRKRFELAFADCGIGFRASLQRNPELLGRVDDDAQALQLALSSRITGTRAPRTNMGIGLKLLVDFSDLLAGDLWIASGSALLQRRTTAGQRVNTIHSIPSWQGAWICLDAPLP